MVLLRKAWFMLILLSLSGCRFLNGNSKQDSLVVARVNNAYLYRADLEGMVPPGTSPEDSTELVANYINNWTRQTLLLQKAELNLSEDLKKFDKQLEEYRKSLIIYAYQERLVEQQLDTSVSEAEIRKYYTDNQDNFALRHNIVKAQYVIFSRTSKDAQKVKSWFISDKEDAREKLLRFCMESALKSNLNDTAWMLMEELEKDIPLQYASQELFLSSRKFVEYQDSVLVYLVNIKDYKIKESVSPLEFEKERIRSIILNIRKLELLRKAEEDMYNDAQKNNAIEIIN